MGDGPADELKRGLKLLGQAGEAPTAPELLAALASALRSSPDELASPPPSFARLVFELREGPPLSSDGVEPRDGDSRLVREALVAAGATWRQEMGRLPRFSELLYALGFVLRVRPERFCRDGAKWAIEDVTAA